jgi:hypothetical protein
MPCRLLVAVVVGLTLALLGCSESVRRVEPNPISGSPNAQPIDGNRLTLVQPGMTKGQVRNMLGPPVAENTYWTWLSWLPGSFNDYRRTSWHYQGLGTVTFSEPRFSGSPSVVYDIDVERRPVMAGH